VVRRACSLGRRSALGCTGFCAASPRHGDVGAGKSRIEEPCVPGGTSDHQRDRDRYPGEPSGCGSASGLAAFPRNARAP